MSLVSRREIKFYIPKNLKKYFNSWFLSKFGIIKSFKYRTINSVYFDSIGYNSAIDNIIGLSNRRKFRFRWYGSTKDTFGNFEVKTKKNLLSRKEIFPLDIKVKDIDLKRMLDLGSLEFTKLPKNLKNQLIDIKLLPTVNVKYKREYYKYYNLDLTLDSNLNFTAFNKEEEKLTKKYQIFEIKYNIKFEYQVRDFLQNFNIAVSRNSKYLQGLYHVNKFNYI